MSSLAKLFPTTPDDRLDDFTPVEWSDWGLHLKRDDLFRYNGMGGGKVRSCLHYIRDHSPMVGGLGDVLDNMLTGAGVPTEQPIVVPDAILTSGSRNSPQTQIVGRIGQQLGIESRLHMPKGKYNAEMEDLAARGCTLVQDTTWWSNVVDARARKDAEDNGGLYIPFGMECNAAVQANRVQAADLPYGRFSRIVISAGSGMTAAGVCWALHDRLMANKPIPELLIVSVGADCQKRLTKWGPPLFTEYTLIKSPYDFNDHLDYKIGDVPLDPHYEAKCMDYLEPDDLFWITGHRATDLITRDDANT